MRRKRHVLAMALCAVLCASALAILRANTPELSGVGFYCGLYNPNWSVTVNNADPFHAVHFEEFRWSGSGYLRTYGPEIIGTTDANGHMHWATFGPDRYGDFYAQVTVNGQLSNPVFYQVRVC